MLSSVMGSLLFSPSVAPALAPASAQGGLLVGKLRQLWAAVFSERIAYHHDKFKLVFRERCVEEISFGAFGRAFFELMPKLFVSWSPCPSARLYREEGLIEEGDAESVSMVETTLRLR